MSVSFSNVVIIVLTLTREVTMLTQIRNPREAKSGDVIAVSNNRNEAIAWCNKLPNGNTLKIQTLNETLTTVRFVL